MTTKTFTEQRCKRQRCGLLFQPVDWQPARMRGYCSEACAPRMLNEGVLCGHMKGKLEKDCEWPLSNYAVHFTLKRDTIRIRAHVECVGEVFEYEQDFDEAQACYRGDQFVGWAIAATLAREVCVGMEPR